MHLKALCFSWYYCGVPNISCPYSELWTSEICTAFKIHSTSDCYSKAWEFNLPLKNCCQERGCAGQKLHQHHMRDYQAEKVNHLLVDCQWDSELLLDQSPATRRYHWSPASLQYLQACHHSVLRTDLHPQDLVHLCVVLGMLSEMTKNKNMHQLICFKLLI